MSIITNSMSNTLISGTNVHDSIENESGNDVTIKADKGNDTIINGLYNGKGVSINRAVQMTITLITVTLKLFFHVMGVQKLQ